MKYRILYDLTTEKVNYFSGFLPMTYVFFVIGIVLLVSYKKSKEPKKLLVGLGFAFISSIFLLVFLVGQFLDIRKAKRIMESGNFFVI